MGIFGTLEVEARGAVVGIGAGDARTMERAVPRQTPSSALGDAWTGSLVAVAIVERFSAPSRTIQVAPKGRKGYL